MRIMLALLLIAALCSATPWQLAEGYTVIATETTRGEYENGRFVSSAPEFAYRFEIDDASGRARLTETTRLRTGTVLATPLEYVIVAREDGSSLSSVLVSEQRRGQAILTLVGKPGALATEVILLGTDFFEYCKASAGRLYLAAGKARKAQSPEDELKKRLAP